MWTDPGSESLFTNRKFGFDSDPRLLDLELLILELFHFVHVYPSQTLIGSLRNGDGDGDGNEIGKKSNRFRQAKQQLCTCITIFVLFSAVVARLQRETA